VKKADGECAAVAAVSEMLTRLTFLRLFSLLLYDFFFLTLTSKALRVLYLLDNNAKRPSSPILYTIA
jgi:hypothetical protein